MSLISSDGKLWEALRKMTDFLTIGILTLLCSIPVVTAGASITAMYDVAFRMLQKREGYVARQFFKAFRTNFKKATILWLIMAAIALILYLDFRILDGIAIQNEDILRKALFVILVLAAMWAGFLLPLQAYFENTLSRMIKNAAGLCIANPVLALAATIIPLFPSLLVYWFPVTLPFVLLFAPSIICYLNGMVFLRIFKKYTKKEESGLANS